MLYCQVSLPSLSLLTTVVLIYSFEYNREIGVNIMDYMTGKCWRYLMIHTSRNGLEKLGLMENELL